MNDIDKAHEILRKSFQYFKITDNFNLSDYELKKNLCILFYNVINGNITESKQSQCALFDLAKFDQKAFLSCLLPFLANELAEKINSKEISKNEEKTCENNKLTDADYLSLVQKIYSMKDGFTIGDPFPEGISITKEESIYYYDLLTGIIQSGESRLQSLDNKLNITNLYIAYNLIKLSGKDFYHFYKLCDLTIELMNHTGDYQLARNISEQIFLLSMQDGNGIYGIYIKANCFLVQKNQIDALIYLCCVVNNLNGQYTFDFWKNLLTHIQILYRDMKVDSLENNLFTNLVKNISFFDSRTKDQIYFSHFATSFSNGNDISQDVYNYLSSNREDIYVIGIDAFKIWYSFLQQVYNQFQNELLQLYINTFKKLLPQSVLSVINNSIGLIDDEKGFINSIIKQITDSKYNEDRNSEIKRSLLSLHNLLDKSFATKDSDLFLNVSRLLSGVQYIAPENDYEGPLTIKYTEEVTENNYDSFLIEFKKVNILDYFDLLLVEKSNNNIYLHFVGKNTQSFIQLKYTIEEILSLVKGLPHIMLFDEKDDFEKECRIKETQIEVLKILDFNIKYSKPYIVIFSTDLSLIPSNLFINDNGFISNSYKSLNMPSLDFMLQSKEIEIRNNIQLWCPLEKGDMALNYAFKGIQDYLDNNSIAYETTMIPKKVLSSDISVIIAHGGDDIANKQYFSAGWFGGEKTTFYTDITKVIKTPKLVILCICHSGKATKDLMYETSQSMQEVLFRLGAQAVIAPKWPLHTEITGLWLPFFLENLKNGQTTFEAFSNTQDYIYTKHPNAGAWACMHYFGNPNIRIKKEKEL